MNKFYFLLLLFTSSFGISQNWNLLNANKTYFYKHVDSLYITNTIKIDSTLFSSTDSIFYIHTTIKVCDTCTNIPSEALGGVAYHVNYPEIFGNSPFYSVTNNHYNFDNNIIQQNTVLSDSWLFNSVSGATATVVNKAEVFILGVLDSIKVIELSTLDTIIISKNHGVISYPDFEHPGKHFELTGYHEGQNSYGEYLPNVWRIYDFSVGDVFCYDIKELSYGLGEEWFRSIRLKVLEDLSTSNSISYRFQVLESYTYIEDAGGWDPIWHYLTSNYIDTFYLDNSIQQLENLYSTIFYVDENNPYNYATTFYNMPFTTNELDYYFNDLQSNDYYRVLSHSYDPNYGYLKHYNIFKVLNGDIYYQWDFSQDIGSIAYNMNISFAEGLGRINDTISDFEYDHTENLVGYIKNGDTIGTIYNFPDDLSAATFARNEFQLYPNPANDYVNISNQFQTVLFYSIGGELVLSVKGNQNQIYVGDLPKGMYLVQAIDITGATFYSKLIVD